jgi:hypothetical protein
VRILYEIILLTLPIWLRLVQTILFNWSVNIRNLLIRIIQWVKLIWSVENILLVYWNVLTSVLCEWNICRLSLFFFHLASHFNQRSAFFFMRNIVVFSAFFCAVRVSLACAVNHWCFSTFCTRRLNHLFYFLLWVINAYVLRVINLRNIVCLIRKALIFGMSAPLFLHFDACFFIMDI